MRVLFITQFDEKGACSRCRVYQYLSYLKAQGIEGEVCPQYPPGTALWRKARAVDAVFIQRRVPSVEQLFLLRRRAPRLLFDFDDAIWLRAPSRGSVRPAPLGRRLRLAATLRLADCVVAGNDYLAAYARRWNARVAILPTPVDLEYYAGDRRQATADSPVLAGIRSSGHQVIRSSPHQPLRLGWVGHPSNLPYLRRLEPSLASLSRRYPWLRLRVVCSEPYESEVIPVENVVWSLEDEVANLRSFDIGLMPLEEEAWARGKCSYKALQYMAVGVPVVLSPVGMNAAVVREGENGLLAAKLGAWERQIARLVESPELRQRLGSAGQRSVAEAYSLAVTAPRLAALLRGGEPEPA